MGLQGLSQSANFAKCGSDVGHFRGGGDLGTSDGMGSAMLGAGNFERNVGPLGGVEFGFCINDTWWQLDEDGMLMENQLARLTRGRCSDLQLFHALPCMVVLSNRKCSKKLCVSSRRLRNSRVICCADSALTEIEVLAPNVQALVCIMFCTLALPDYPASLYAYHSLVKHYRI